MSIRGIDELQIDLEAIGHVLRDNTLAVPLYQRSYAWEEEHVRDLLQDISSALSGAERDYFVGSLVVSKGQSGLDVVDGQQRLATTVILFAAMRDWFDANGDEPRAQQIESAYLVTRDFKTQEALPKLRLNEVDRDYFGKRVLSPRTSVDREVPATKESHRRIDRAAELAQKHIEHWVETSNEPTVRLTELKDYLDEHVRVIWVRVPDDANAFVIFETLNDRGLELAISDLLKNFLFWMVEDRLPEAQSKWISMLATLEAVQDESIVVEFIRHLWSSKFGSTRERDLYAEIKKKTTSKQAAIDLVKELSESALLYAAILNTDNAFWTRYGPTAKGHMAAMNGLGMVQIRPLLLAVLAKLSVKETKEALRLMVSWGVRFLITGGLGGGTLEKHYADAAQAVRAGSIKTAKQLAKQLGSVVPRDKEFESAVQIARVSKPSLARYYLHVLERQQKGEAQPELVPNANQEEVNLEHILPRSPDATWSTTFSDDEAAAYASRLGNLTLLAVDPNGAAGSESFAAKKSILAASKFVLTKLAARSKQWSPSTIEARQKTLAAIAVKAWPLT